MSREDAILMDGKEPQWLLKIFLLSEQWTGRSHLAPKAVAISNLLPLLVLGALEGKKEEGGSQAVSQVAVELVLVTLAGGPRHRRPIRAQACWFVISYSQS